MARPRQISDDDIFTEVRRCVAEAGARLSLDTVAERLGVTTPALFKRFGSRNALLLAALRPGRPPFLDELARGPDARPIKAQLAGWFETIGTWLAEHMPQMMALHESGIAVCDVMDELEQAPPVVLIRTLRKWLGRGQALGLLRIDDPDTSAMAMVGALSQRTFVNYLSRSAAVTRDLRRDAQRLAELFVGGLSPTSKTSSRRPARRPHATRERA